MILRDKEGLELFVEVNIYDRNQKNNNKKDESKYRYVLFHIVGFRGVY